MSDDEKILTPVHETETAPTQDAPADDADAAVEFVTPRPPRAGPKEFASVGRDTRKLAKALYEADCAAQGYVVKWDAVSTVDDTREFNYWCNLANHLMRTYRFTNI